MINEQNQIPRSPHFLHLLIACNGIDHLGVAHALAGVLGNVEVLQSFQLYGAFAKLIALREDRVAFQYLYTVYIQQLWR